MKKALYKYCAKNNKDRSKSHFNGKERIGYTIAYATSIAEEEKLIAKGYHVGLPTSKATKKPVEKSYADNAETNTLHSESSLT